MKMKRLIIALVFGMGLTGIAQESTTPTKADIEKMIPEQRQQKHIQKLTKELTLDAKQQEAVSKILADKSVKAQNWKAQKSSGEKMTTEEKTAFKNTMLAAKADADVKMKAILSADQYQKWNVIQAEKKEKMKQKRVHKTE